MANFSSNNIHIYPASARTNTVDRLMIEHNLINIVNRLTDLNSFIISGLGVSKKNGNISIGIGKCNINGYYIDVTTEQSTGITWANGIVLLKLHCKTSTIEGSDVTQLAGTDKDTDDSIEYTGLEIDLDKNGSAIDPSDSDGETTDETYYILPIAKINGDSATPLNVGIKYETSSIKLEHDYEGLYKGSNEPITLKDLLDNFIIDDGVLS